MDANSAKDFWSATDHLVSQSGVRVDRPRGSAHPRFPSASYPLDYGSLLDTTGGDGAEVDVWLGAGWRADEPHPVTAILVTIDLLKRDAEVKLLLSCTEAETRGVVEFQESGAMHAFLVPRPAMTSIGDER